MKRLFDDRIEQFNFRDEAGKCAKHINQFIEKTTRNNIKDFLEPSDLSDAVFVMVNAVYFKAQWVKII